MTGGPNFEDYRRIVGRGGGEWVFPEGWHERKAAEVKDVYTKRARVGIAVTLASFAETYALAHIPVDDALARPGVDFLAFSAGVSASRFAASAKSWPRFSGIAGTLFTGLGVGFGILGAIVTVANPNPMAYEQLACFGAGLVAGTKSKI